MITFDSNGADTNANPTQLSYGQVPNAPVKSGFTFDGWYTKNGISTGDWGNKYLGNAKLYSDTTVYAK